MYLLLSNSALCSHTWWLIQLCFIWCVRLLLTNRAGISQEVVNVSRKPVVHHQETCIDSRVSTNGTKTEVVNIIRRFLGSEIWVWAVMGTGRVCIWCYHFWVWIRCLSPALTSMFLFIFLSVFPPCPFVCFCARSHKMEPGGGMWCRSGEIL